MSVTTIIAHDDPASILCDLRSRPIPDWCWDDEDGVPAEPVDVDEEAFETIARCRHCAVKTTVCEGGDA